VSQLHISGRLGVVVYEACLNMWKRASFSNIQPHSATAAMPAGRWRQGLRARNCGASSQYSSQYSSHAPSLAPNRRQEQPKDWALEDRVSGLLHRGTLEAGLGGGGGAAAGSGGAGCYFLLTKKGADFVAQPVHEWFTFRPVNARWGVVPTLRRTHCPAG